MGFGTVMTKSQKTLRMTRLRMRGCSGPGLSKGGGITCFTRFRKSGFWRFRKDNEGFAKEKCMYFPKNSQYVFAEMFSFRKFLHIWFRSVSIFRKVSKFIVLQSFARFHKV